MFIEGFLRGETRVQGWSGQAFVADTPLPSRGFTVEKDDDAGPGQGCEDATLERA